MANALLNVDQITNAALKILHQKSNFIGSINRQYDDQFAREGAKIVVVDLNERTGQAAADAVVKQGGEAIFVRADVTSDDSMRAAADAGVAKFGKIDSLLCCAGGSLPADKNKEIEAEAKRLVANGTYSSMGEAYFNLDLNGGAYSCARCHTKGWSYGDPQITGGGALGRRTPPRGWPRCPGGRTWCRRAR